MRCATESVTIPLNPSIAAAAGQRSFDAVVKGGMVLETEAATVAFNLGSNIAVFLIFNCAYLLSRKLCHRRDASVLGLTEVTDQRCCGTKGRLCFDGERNTLWTLRRFTIYFINPWMALQLYVWFGAFCMSALEMEQEEIDWAAYTERMRWYEENVSPEAYVSFPRPPKRLSSYSPAYLLPSSKTQTPAPCFRNPCG